MGRRERREREDTVLLSECSVLVGFWRGSGRGSGGGRRDELTGEVVKIEKGWNEKVCDGSWDEGEGRGEEGEGRGRVEVGEEREGVEIKGKRETGRQWEKIERWRWTEREGEEMLAFLCGTGSVCVCISERVIACVK